MVSEAVAELGGSIPKLVRQMVVRQMVVLEAVAVVRHMVVLEAAAV